MSTTTNRRYKVVRASEMHRRNHVRNARAPCDYFWTFAETCIPDSTRLVVARVRRLKNLPGKGRLECCDFHNDLVAGIVPQFLGSVVIRDLASPEVLCKNLRLSQAISVPG